jgi:hypothetical protein
VELLPARTVLSLLPAGIPGANGEHGTPGANGNSVNLLGMVGSSGSGSSYPYVVGDTSGSAHSSHS